MKKFIMSKLVLLLSLIGLISIGGCSLWWFYQPEMPEKERELN
jgi:cyclic lactone autoinducer peptide